MTSNPSETLRLTDVEWDTATFLTLATSSILQSNDPDKALKDDPPVVGMHYDKKKKEGEHELIVNDLEEQSRSTKYVLERTVILPESGNPTDNTVRQFMHHPAMKKVLDAVVETVDLVPTPILTGSAAVAVGAAVAGQISIPVAAAALLPLSLKSLTSRSAPSDFPLMDEGPNISSSHLPRTSRYAPIVAPQYSLAEKTSMTVADVFQVISDSQSVRVLAEAVGIQKLPRDSRASDRFLAEERFDNTAYNDALRVMTFHPKCLTRLHIAILADVIHIEHPLYALLRRQCYWFACTFFYAAQIIDYRLRQNRREPNLRKPDVDNDSTPMDEMFMPYHLIHGKGVGSWKGIQIHGIKMVILDHIVKKFEARYDEILAEIRKKSAALEENNRNMQLLQYLQAKQVQVPEAGFNSGPTKRK